MDPSGNETTCSFDITVEGDCSSTTELTPTFFIDGAAFFNGQERDAIYTVENVGDSDASDVEFLITKPGSSTFDFIFYDGITPSSLVISGFSFALDNEDWDITAQSSSIILIKLKPGVVIPAGGFSTLGINVEAITDSGSAQTVGQLIDGTGGDQDQNNNVAQQTFVIN